MSLIQQNYSIGFSAVTAFSKRVAGLSGWRRSAACFGLGVVSVSAFAPLHVWPVLFLTMPALVWMLDGIADLDSAAGRAGKPRWRQAMLAGWWFGFGFFMVSLYWIGFAFFVEADKFAWLVPLPVLAFPAALAIFFALAFAAATRFWRASSSRIFVFAAALFAADWLRGHILTGFPWNIWGYALAGNEAVAQSASLFGVYGLTLLAPLIFASPATLADAGGRNGRAWPLPVLCCAILAACWAWGTQKLALADDDTVDNVRLRIVQANIPQTEKWNPESRKWIFERYLDLSARPSEAGAGTAPTHVIWPETSTPFIFMLNDGIFEPDARVALDRLTKNGMSLILGGERVEATPRGDGTYTIDDVYNSLFVIEPGAEVSARYDKVHLVPFGEYLPLESLLSSIGLRQLAHANTGFAAGTAARPLTAPGAPSFLPLICYEAIFPQMASSPGERPSWILNLTNDAWFGTTSGPYQHLHQTRLRAIEQGLPLIRAANTGVSAVIDAHGQVRASLQLNATGVLDFALPVAIEPTLYTQWSETCLMLLAFFMFILYRIVMQVE